MRFHFFRYTSRLFAILKKNIPFTEDSYVVRKGRTTMKLFQWISSSLRTKLLTMFVILTSIPLIAVGLVSYQKSYNTISGHNKAATLLVADQLARNIDVLFADTGKLLELGKNPQVLHFLYSQSETYEDAKEILRTFDLYRQTYKYDSVLNISMTNLYGKGISERKGVFQLDHNPLRNPHFLYLMDHPDAILNVPPTDASVWDRLDGFSYPQRNVITIIAAVKQRITHEVIGFITIDLDDSVVEHFIDNVTIGKTGYFYVVDQSGSPIFRPSALNEKAVPASKSITVPSASHGSFVHTSVGKPQFVVYTSSQATGWKIVGIAPLQEIVEDANKIRQLIIFSVALSIFFTITLYFFITARLTRPIRLLKNNMRLAAAGNLEAKVKPSGNDEIADLGSSFNIMLAKIKGLLEQSIREQEQIQKAELRTLQAQINPHFLYNTLESIVWMAEAGKKEQVIQLVKALSQFFRISLNKGRDWISIKTELEHVRSYLVIQQMRYRDILDYRIEIAESIESYPILKMTLQPLVENALYHGIKNKRGKGLIQISGYEDTTGTLVLTVEDNGIGMSVTRLAEVRSHLEIMRETHTLEVETDFGFGLSNVHHRLRLYFGQQYGLEVDSEDQVGSRVTVRIPKR